MPLYIEDEATTQLVNQLAKLLGTTEQDAVRLAVAAAIKRTTEAVPLRDRFAVLRKTHGLPHATGKIADEAFFDDL